MNGFDKLAALRSAFEATKHTGYQGCDGSCPRCPVEFALEQSSPTLADEVQRLRKALEFLLQNDDYHIGKCADVGLCPYCSAAEALETTNTALEEALK